MFKLCVFVALLSLAAAAPAPAPAPGPSPSLLGPAVIAGPIGPIAPIAPLWGPSVIAPRIVSVVPGPAVSHIAVSQVHPSPLLLKHVW